MQATGVPHPWPIIQARCPHRPIHMHQHDSVTQTKSRRGLGTHGRGGFQQTRGLFCPALLALRKSLESPPGNISVMIWLEQGVLGMEKLGKVGKGWE